MRLSLGKNIAIKITLSSSFNFQLLGENQGRSRLITIENFRNDSSEEQDFQMLWFGAEYPQSFFGFGYPRERGSYKNLFLQVG